MEEKTINKHEQQPVPVVLIPQYIAEDEINLIDLWTVIACRKVLVFGVMLACLVVSAVYAMLAPPIYKANAHLLPPLLSQLGGLDTQIYTPDVVYNLFKQEFQSRTLRRLYFDKHKLLARLASGDVNADDVFKKMFDKKITISGRKGPVTVSFEGRNPKLAAQWINGLVDMANQKTAQILVNDSNFNRKAKIKALLDKINVARISYKQRKNDKVAKLKEAIRIAKDLGIKGILAMPNKKSLAIDPSSSSMQNPSEGGDLYMMGYKALSEQLKMLRQRKNEDSYVPGLRDMEEKVSLLKSMRLDPALISPVRIDQQATVPDHHIKPKRRLIVLSGLIVGLMVGVFGAFVMEFFAQVKRTRESGMA